MNKYKGFSRISILFFLLSMLFLLSAQLFAQQDVSLKQIFQWPYGETGKIIREGVNIYICCGTSVLCFANMGNDYRLLQVVNTPSFIKDIALDKDNLYLATKNNGLIIYEIDNLYTPVKTLFPNKEVANITLTDEVIIATVGLDGLFGMYIDDWEEFLHLPTKNLIWKSLYHDTILYLIEGLANRNLFVIKVPIPERKLNTEVFTEDIEELSLQDLINSLEDDEAANLWEILANDNGVLFPEDHDLEDDNQEDNDNDEDLLEFLRNQPRHLTTLNRGNQISDIAILKDHLYIADGLGGLAVYDIRNPQKIVFRFSLSLEELSKQYPELAIKEVEYNSVSISGGLLFASGNEELHIFSIQDKGLTLLANYKPVSNTQTAVFSAPPHFINYKDNNLITTDKHGKINFSKHYLPDNFSTQRELIFSTNITCMAFDNDRMFLGSEYGTLWEIALNYQGTPFSAVKIEIPGLINDLAYEGSYLYVATGIGMGAVNVSRANNPSLVSFIPFPYPYNHPNLAYGWVNSINVNNKIVYGAAGEGGLWVVDFTTPHLPETIAQMQVNSNINKVVVDPLTKRVYGIGKPQSFIFSIAGGFNPILLKSIETPKGNGTCVAAGRYLYIGLEGSSPNSPAQIDIYDVFSPYTPKYLSSIKLAYNNMIDMTLLESLLAVVCNDELVLYNISNTAKPYLIQYFPYPGTASRIASFNNKLGLASYNAGSLILELNILDLLRGIH